MPEDIPKTVGAQIAGGAREEVVSEVLDFVADAAKGTLVQGSLWQLLGGSVVLGV